ncbi:G-type lectin S-receptor-like serine/threonine-protein kinase SD1-1 isoform X2 [Cornus florida]|nr:G-type lectin S-receptor-like serine/threonine-protein kinase SD1-1 isoform X2 [Cornus florida]XP_059660559.1 G-type lectin S-receptor-like serine/threonine-protein kinase SD1-1 isoform X2 [Cornus florida]
MMVTLNRDYCDRYGMCGPYGNCYAADPNCRCLKGFTPKSPQAWSQVVWTDGCVRRHELNCGNGDGFVKYTGLKLPDNITVWGEYNQEECRVECLKTCGCMAYTNIDVHGNGSSCGVWLNQLIDMREFGDEGEEIYMRMARAELESIAAAKRRRKVVTISVVLVSTVSGIILSGVVGWYICRLKKARKKVKQENNPYNDYTEESQEDDLELPLFDISTILVATDKFSFKNKIGEGGFGPVYKGELPNGQEIAIKRLSQSSGQGLKEFKNEVILIAKLQHRNLVKLLGCCIQGEERILIYEYMSNKSLNYFIFDKNGRRLLPWKKRFNIILGIARGLLYLHQDSRLRIIHRDLKASNILLDKEMDPKISDFGIARIFGGEQTEEKTMRVIGTYGYMSPEYAMSGHFSVKSDAFSFGVLVLEIISGQKNWGFYHPDHDQNLIGHAWKLWNEEKPMELMDPVLQESFSVNEVVRCIQVGLLCVQHRAEDRPTMSSVVFMLSNENAVLPQPKEPGFSVENSSLNIDSSTSGQDPSTANEITITAFDGR